MSSSGIFKIITPVSIASMTGGPYYRETNDNIDNADLIAGLIGNMNAGDGLGIGSILTFGSAVSGVIRFAFDTVSPIISVDDGFPVKLSGLPVGFTVASATMSFSYQGLQNAGPTNMFMQFS